MLDLLWLNHLPDDSLEGGIKLANQLYWNITVAGNEHRWVIRAGEAVILRTDSRDVADAFLYGLGLAYGVLPEEVFFQLREGIRKLSE